MQPRGLGPWECIAYRGEVRVVEPDKCEGWEWFRITSLPQEMAPGHRLAMELYLNKKGKKVGFVDIGK